MKSDTLHIVTAVANPIRWKSRILLARAAIVDWLRESNVHGRSSRSPTARAAMILPISASICASRMFRARDDSRVVEGKLPEHRDFPAPP